MKRLSAFVAATGWFLCSGSALGATAAGAFRVSANVVASCTVAASMDPAAVGSTKIDATCVRNSVVVLKVEPAAVVDGAVESPVGAGQAVTLYY